MSEYIEREAVLDRLAKVNMDTYYGFTAAVQFGVDHAIQCIKEAPAADVAPVRHGRWNDINPTVLLPGSNWVCRCSLCGCPQDYKHNYCPNCGALMDGKEEGHV